MPDRECPMCGETMRLTERTVTERVPGTAQATTTTQSEWVCPECEHFEDAEDATGRDG